LDYLPNFVEGIQQFAEVKNEAYDLIHSHYWLSGLAALEIKSFWRIPVLHMFHTLGLMRQRVARIPGEADGDYRIEGERAVLEGADGIIAATLAELAQLQWLYQADTQKITIIPPGVDLSHFYPIPAEEAKEFIGVPPCECMLLYVGRIEPLKGIDTLIHAIAHLKSQGINVCLAVIGGEGDQIEGNKSEEMIRLQSIRENAGISELVTFLGTRSQDTLPYYYSAAEAVVVPSYYESFGMVALEAMACGTPVVASQVGGLAFLVQDGITGFTVPVDEPLALADRLRILTTNPELQHKMGREAAEFARNYSWEKIADQIVNIYSKYTLHKTGQL